MYRKSLLIALSFLCATSFAFAEGDITLTEVEGLVGWGSLSPDGATIVLAEGENFDSLVLYDIESGDESVVFTGRRVKYPRIDPEGEKIIFTGEKPYAGLWIVGSDGTGLQPFPSKKGASADDAMAIWSPDGARVAWIRKGSELWVANADGSTAAALGKVPLVDGSDLITTWRTIDWQDGEILVNSSSHGSFDASDSIDVIDDSTGRSTETRLWEKWAQFCDSPDSLLYISFADSQVRFWSAPEKGEDTGKDLGSLALDGDITFKSPEYTRSADSSRYLVCETDPESEFYLSMFLLE